MVHIKYEWDTLHTLSSSSVESFLLSNKRGSYYFQGLEDTSQLCLSRYCGFHISYPIKNEWNMFKIIHSFLPHHSIARADKKPTHIKLHTLKGHCDVTLFPTNILTFETVYCDSTLTLDCRPIYDFDSVGRFYFVEEIPYADGTIIIVTYEKKESNDINSQAQKLTEDMYHRIFLALFVKGNYQLLKTWHKVESTLEKRRGAGNESVYVYDLLSVSENSSIYCSANFNRDTAISELKQFLDTKDALQKTFAQYQRSISQSALPTADDRLQIAYKLALTGFDSMYVHPTPLSPKGLYAGLPWFFHFWTRDEAISLCAMQDNPHEVKKIVLRQLDVLFDGRVSNRTPRADLGSADGIGWVCKRLHDILGVPNLFSIDELVMLHDKLTHSAQLQFEYYGKDGLIWNTELETWMDTGTPYDTRAGARVEIQALFLIQLRCINAIKRKLSLSIDDIEQYVVKGVRKKLFSDVLLDGLNADGNPDYTIRPNVFLAYYIYPWLLSDHEWRHTFDMVLDHCYLKRGAITSIQTNHPLYKPEYTGENNLSYHRGDSWYYINNLTATVLCRFDRERYEPVILQLLTSSVNEILDFGAAGCHAEVSSAEKMTSDGCVQQTWSLATFIELVQTLYNS